MRDSLHDAGHSEYRPSASLFHIVVTKRPSSEKASDPDFDCAWGEKMRIGPEGVGPVPKVRTSWAWWLAARSRAAAG